MMIDPMFCTTIRLMDPFGHQCIAVLPSARVQRVLIKLLHRIGLFPCYKGYRCALAALSAMLDDPTLLTASTTRLYPLLANRLRCSTSMVERNLRHAIGIVFAHGNRAVLEQCFGTYTDGSRPTNTAFLGGLFSVLQLQLLEMASEAAGAQSAQLELLEMAGETTGPQSA